MSNSHLTPTLAAMHLEQQAIAIEKMVIGVDPEQARWKPTPDDWSILEVINHLYDEERDDFRQRFDLTLHHPDQEWPPIHPSQWVVERRYNEREFAPSVQAWLAERSASVRWLRSLGEVDLTSARRHPQFGSMTAGELLAAWVAHDRLHIRQLNELGYLYWRTVEAYPWDPGYAGDW